MIGTQYKRKCFRYRKPPKTSAQKNTKNEFEKSGSFFYIRANSTRLEIQFLSKKTDISYAGNRGEHMIRLSHSILRTKMLEMEWKQEPLAEVLGISDRHIRNLCYKDIDASVSLCYKLSKVFGTSIEELLIIKEFPE